MERDRDGRGGGDRQRGCGEGRPLPERDDDGRHHRDERRRDDRHQDSGREERGGGAPLGGPAAAPAPPAAAGQESQGRGGGVGRPGYGLAHGSSAPEHLRAVDTSQRGAETRARLEEGARSKVEEERRQAAQRHQKKDYRTGQITGGGDRGGGGRDG